jgi:Domain of unknown function (DUF5666)
LRAGFLCAIFLLVFNSSTLPARAQQMRGVAVAGYVTAVHLPSGFDVNGHHVVMQPGTAYGMSDSGKPQVNSPLRGALQVGAFVYVIGSTNNATKTSAARYVLFRDLWDQKISGQGVIDRVMAMRELPVFRVDGYTVRISRSTEMAFHGDLANVATVGPGVWMHFVGRRDSTGAIEAEKAAFTRFTADKAAARSGANEARMEFEPPNFETGAPGMVHMWGQHPIPADAALQGRIDRVGQKVVPGYQKALQPGDPAKLNFRFYAVDAPALRSIFCSSTGLVLIPVHLSARLQNDDQLAAVLADAVAYLLERQAHAMEEAKLLMGIELIGDATSVGITRWALLPVALTAQVPPEKAAIWLTEQRGREALALMSDAGYDAWQAPEAWRRLAPKILPNDLDRLPYPDRSGYQLSILNLQYRSAAKPAHDTADSSPLRNR